MAEQLPYEARALDLANFLGRYISATFEKAGEDFAFVAAVNALYRKRGGKVDAKGSSLDEFGDPYDEDTWQTAYTDDGG